MTTRPRPSSIGRLCVTDTGTFAKDTYCGSEDHDHLPNPEWWITEDGYEFKVGDLVYNYYDGEWVTVVSEPNDQLGWFTVRRESGSEYSLNSVRISKHKPEWSN